MERRLRHRRAVHPPDLWVEVSALNLVKELRHTLKLHTYATNPSDLFHYAHTHNDTVPGPPLGRQWTVQFA